MNNEFDTYYYSSIPSPKYTFQKTVLNPTNNVSNSSEKIYTVSLPGIVLHSSIWIIVIGLIISLFIVVLIILTVYFLVREVEKIISPVQPNTIIDEVNNTTGSSDNGEVTFFNGDFYQDGASCRAGPTRLWENSDTSLQDTCQCAVPFFGPECSRESYNQTYTSIGTPGEDTILSNIGPSVTVDRLSFPFQNHPGRLPEEIEPPNTETLCTDMCDKDTDCLGVLWNQASTPSMGIQELSSEKPTCKLIKGEVIVRPGNNIPYSTFKDSSLYMKSREDPHFKDRVFVYSGNKPLRYWLLDEYSDFFGNSRSQAMFDRQLVNFMWRPTNLINTTGCTDDSSENCLFGNPWIGIFSNDTFQINDANILVTLRQSSTNTVVTIDDQEYILIRSNDSTIQIPDNWVQVWGMFINPSQEDTSVLDNSETITPVSVSNTMPTNYRSLPKTVMKDVSGGYFEMSNSITTFETDVDEETHTETYIWNKPISSTTRSKFKNSQKTPKISLSVNSRLLIMSTDNLYHDLVSTNSDWYPTNNPYNIGVSKQFKTTLYFSKTGVHYLMDRIHPTQVKLIVEVYS